MRPDLRLPPLTEMAKREAPLAKAKPLAMLQENPLVGLVMRPDLHLPALTEMAK
jgi:hypothetical protein